LTKETYYDLPRRHDSCKQESAEFLYKHKNKDLRDAEKKGGGKERKTKEAKKKSHRQGESHKF
jgi:hypothetical protein